MKKLSNIKVIAFDYGGTLDIPGVHWFDFLWSIVNTKLSHDISVTKDDFWEAYVYGERKLESNPIPPDTDLFHNLLIKCNYEIEYLAIHKKDIILSGAEQIKLANQLASSATDLIINQNYPESRKVLSGLHNKYSLYIVSNYYGNLKTILEEAHFMPYITQYFDSTLVGIRKPDPALWQMAINASGVSPEEILVVGDSMKNDIAPAKFLGCKTAWLTGEASEDYQGIVISRLMDLLELV